MNQKIRTSTYSIVSLISSIAGWTILPIIGWLIAIITGHIAIDEIRRGEGLVEGKGFAVAGLWLSYIPMAVIIILTIITIIMAGLLWIDADGTGSRWCQYLPFVARWLGAVCP